MRLDVPQVAVADARRLEAALHTPLQERCSAESNSGMTLVGPYRDDFRFLGVPCQRS